jgi:hypothetical protein
MAARMPTLVTQMGSNLFILFHVLKTHSSSRNSSCTAAPTCFAKSYHGIRGTAEEFNTRLRNFETAKFLADKAASGWSPYDRVPRIELVRLRSLCIRGRASPPPEPILERLFGAPAAPTKTKTAVTPLPREVFWHVLSFWRASQ